MCSSVVAARNLSKMQKNIVVVVPTYNEKENVLKLIDAIDGLGIPLDILMVDDNSPDGTGDIIEDARKTRKNLHIIHREKKQGIGPAYIEGFKHVLSNGAYDFVVQMDADFSHNPKDIPRLIKKAEECDVAVGSRYAKGGSVSDKWSISRKLISRFGNLYARLITGLKVNDATAGFKCYKTSSLKGINLDDIFLNGYGFQIQILYELYKKGFLICEVPIFFDERLMGKSKMSLNIVGEAFFSLIILRLKSLFGSK